MKSIARLAGGTALIAAIAAVPATARAHTDRRPEPAVRTTHVVRTVRTCSWIPAHRVVRTVPVVVRAGWWKETVIPARYALRWDSRHCHLVTVEVEARRVERTWIPAVIEHRREVVVVPGRWDCADGCDHRHARTLAEVRRGPVLKHLHGN